jgi:site-specific DNA-methyltransferase (adenine-specific)
MRTPDWQSDDGAIQLHCCDCADVLPLVYADAIITDPPYGISYPCNMASRGRSNWAESKDYPDVIGDDRPFDPSPLLAMNVPTLLWGGNFFADKLPPAGGWLVWDKLRPDALDQATCELAWSNFVKGVRRFSHLWNGMMRASEHGENYHPMQKPVALFEWIYTLPWTPQGIIFDPYMGSGPNVVACIRSGRGCIGVEQEPQHFQTAVKRIKAEMAQPRLFTAPEPKHEQATMFGGER